MRLRRLARWTAGLVAAAAFGVAAILGVSAANADETDTPTDNSVETNANEWD